MKQDLCKELLALVLLATTFSIRAETPAGDWPLCPQPLPIPERPPVETAGEPGEIHISSDKAELEEQGISTLEGNVEINRDDQQVTADSVAYDRPGATADLTGNIQYWDDVLYMRSDKGHIDFSKESGHFENTNYVLRDNRARGRADELEHEYKQRTDLHGVDYTTCDPEDNFWKLSADEIHLDHVTEWGNARNVVLRIKNIPVFYTPYMSFPLSDKRKTGFLFPSFGSSNRNGYELTVPYYLNIAPEMDATLAPRIMTDRGLMLAGEFRYLLGRGDGMLQAEYMPSDDEFDDDDRYLVGFNHQQSFWDSGKLFLTYNRVSDKEYFEDFGANINISSTRYLERRADLSYKGDWWNLSGKLQSYQTVDRTIPVEFRPYKRLPQVRFNAFSPARNRQLNFDLQSEISYFDRGDNDTVVNDVNGLRFDLYPSLSYPIHTPYSFFEPRAGLRYTQYQLNDTGPFFDTSPSRLLPVLSLDSGLFLERDTSLFGTPFLQTLEPRLYYLYVPHDNQTDLPVFDTGMYDFSLDSLFRDNRFTGPDRMNDANQFILAITSRILDPADGEEAGFISLGQIYYLHDRDVFLPDGKARTEISSPFIAQVGASFIEDWRLRGELQWDPNNNKTEKLAGFVQYHPDPDKIINLGYRVRRTTDSISSSSQVTQTDIEQSELSFL
ncbi:MAG: LPS-assembly protein LptD, partial [Gammaproteobacteria bacterium]